MNLNPSLFFESDDLKKQLNLKKIQYRTLDCFFRLINNWLAYSNIIIP